MTAITDSSKPILAPKAKLRWDDVRQQYLLLFPEGLLILNQTAHDILKMCDGNHDVLTIVKSLSAKYESQNPIVDRDIREILEKLAKKRLLLIPANEE